MDRAIHRVATAPRFLMPPALLDRHEVDPALFGAQHVGEVVGIGLNDHRDAIFVRGNADDSIPLALVPDCVALLEGARRIVKVPTPVREVHNQVAHRYLCDRNHKDGIRLVCAARSLKGTAGGFIGRLLADGNGPARILPELHHDPEFMPMGHKVSRFRDSYYVVDLRIHGEAEGNPLELCTRMQGLPGWGFRKQIGRAGAAGRSTAAF
jgi:hypothetical protein